MSTCGFSWAHYADCLRRSSSEVEFVHDLDLSVENARKAADLEYNEQIRATYFVRLHANGYNALSSGVLSLLDELRARRHTIGLHFEPGFYGAGEGWKKGLVHELLLLSEVIREPVTRVSQHEPSRSALKLTAEPLLAEVTLYGYGSPHYHGAKYISDSGARWREGCMCEHIGKHERLIILTHPEWWFAKHPGEGY